MSREIKFRAWDGEEMIILSNAGIQMFDFENGKVLAFSDDGYTGFWAHECYDKVKCDYPIMQFTGLKDKNGKEIYEGDIVLANGAESVLDYDFSQARKFVSPTIQDNRHWEKRSSNYVVYWNEVFSQFDFKPVVKGHSIDTNISTRDYEIIGNIYENPELLNQ